jgi:hypothetical protein
VGVGQCPDLGAWRSRVSSCLLVCWREPCPGGSLAEMGASFEQGKRGELETYGEMGGCGAAA